MVVIDECSMLGADLMRHIRRQLRTRFVLFVGDRAQLPPVNEGESESFATKSKSVLTEIMRQAAGNPIIHAATIIRASQGTGVMDWSWVKTAEARPFGVYVPDRSKVDAWMHKAFTSDAVQQDPDTFRYLAWTNARVALVNKRIRRWIYGDQADLAPFMAGERALARSPIVLGGTVVVQTNEEFTVLAIDHDLFEFELEDHGVMPAWRALVPSWGLVIRADDGSEHKIHMVRDQKAYEEARERILDEAPADRERWRERRDFDDALAKLQPIYAMTLHSSQGSTFTTCFLDVADIRRRVADNILEAQQLFYVGLTRPSRSAVLVGV